MHCIFRPIWVLLRCATSWKPHLLDNVQCQSLGIKTFIQQSRNTCRFQYPFKFFNQLRHRTTRFGVPPEPTPKLTPQQVTSILRANETMHDFKKPGTVLKSVDWNQLSSNNPIEDSLAIAQLQDGQTYLLGVFDGHGGPSCARVLAKRLLSYIAASLPAQHLPGCLINQMTQSPEFRPELESLYVYAFNQYLSSVSHLREKLTDDESQFNINDIENALVTAFDAMDHQLSEEALAFLLGPKMANILKSDPHWDWNPWWKDPHPKRDKLLQLATLSVAMSGAVACVGLISFNQLVVANTGDCQALLGYIGEDGSWCYRKLSREHTSENPGEIQRLYRDHPTSEQDTILRMDRLLGQLMPLRAFGDFRFKWPREVLEKWVVPIIGESAVPPHYKTPPYLTAHPEIIRHTLTPKDKFLVIASDGLWDLLSPTQVVRLVGEHQSGRVAFGPLTLPPGDVTVGDVNSMLHQRREGLSKRPLDTNAATHLMRHALGSTETGLDPHRLAELLAMPDDVVRLFRDDISIIVAYFDTDYLLKTWP
nr:EOG090X05SW [Cyclestheria hislopi]